MFMPKKAVYIRRVSVTIITLLAIVLLAFRGKAVVFKESQMPEQMGSAEQHLLDFVRDKESRNKDREGLAQAIERLGEMRSYAAIDDLVQLITFNRTLPSNEGIQPTFIDKEHPVTPLSVYPATGALFHIGEPALPALMKLIETSDPESLASQNAVYTLMAIFREDPEAGVQYLQDAADQAPTPEASKSLLRAVARARTLLR
jgi:hypothetical protein